ncbi:MAG: DUF421 domain-containing protein [Actinomycetales bacterium]|nr:DUF421 domain-containing protein [Actinomycetales bacterium]
MEIVVRAVIVFVFLWIVTRIVGRATLGELSTFELILFITMGDLVQQAVTQQDYSITSAILAVGTFTLLTIVLAWINARFRKARVVTHGVPVVVVLDGEPLVRSMRTERLSPEDLFAAARTQGIERISDVKMAVLEANGQLSFFTSDGSSDGGSEKPEAG